MNSLQNIHLRRIHWAIFSPSLLSYPFSAAYVRDEAHAEAILDVLKQLDEIPDEVDAYFDSLAKLPMGKYFEQLLFYIFEKDERFEVLAKNHQVKQGNETIGEIDLILKDVVNGTYEHWEIALKFYLQSHASDQHDAFIGPNGVDDLAKKMKKLTERQIPLTIDQTEIGISHTQAISNRVYLKGQFFYHFGHKKGCNIFPKHADPMHERGWWCRLSEIENCLDKNLSWTMIDKPEWIGHYPMNKNHKLFNYNDICDSLKQHFNFFDSAKLCVGSSSTDGNRKELSRVFVVKNDWPKTHKKI